MVRLGYCHLVITRTTTALDILLYGGVDGCLIIDSMEVCYDHIKYFVTMCWGSHQIY